MIAYGMSLKCTHTSNLKVRYVLSLAGTIQQCVCTIQTTDSFYSSSLTYSSSSIEIKQKTKPKCKMMFIKMES